MSTGTGTDVRRVGFVGLGSQGGPMARRIAESGRPTTLWARRAASLEPFADTPAATATGLAELGRDCDLVCVCVVDHAGVQEVVDQVLPAMAAGGVIAVHSTVHPDTCRRLAERAGERGIDLVDAPVSGGGGAALEGKLLVMVGGDEAVVARLRPVFASYADPVLHLGPVGSGQLAKILNNTLMAAHLGTAGAIFALGRELGVEPAALAEVIGNGSGRSFAASLLPGTGFSLAPLSTVAGPLLQKDVRLLAELAAAAGVGPGAVLPAADAALAAMDHPR